MDQQHETSSLRHLRDLPLAGLMAFEAAVRLGNFRRAAEALSVTPSALSHRVRQLELRLGAELFSRHGNRVAPTSKGLEYYEAAVAALGALSYAGDELEMRERRVVRIAVMPMLGMAWLSPRLQQFSDQNPTLRFEVHTIRATDNPGHLDADLVVHYGAPSQEGTRSFELFSDSLQVVGSPEFLDRHGPFRGLNDFLRVNLLRYSLLSWHLWLRSAFDANVHPQGSYFDDAMTVLAAVREGMGLTVITGIASQPLLDAGELVLVHPHRAQAGVYCATLSETGQLKPAAGAFFQWLQTQR